MHYRCWLFLNVLSTVVACAAQAPAETTRFPVALDRWMYPFNGTPGTRAAGSTFGAFDSPSFDNRDAQTVVGFDVSSLNGLAPHESVASAVVHVTIAVDEGFRYDPTYDGFATYDSQPDADEGRPMELFGVATRNGFTGLTVDAGSSDPELFQEDSAFSTAAGTFRGVRSVFATDFAGGEPRDVSNNVDEGFDPIPFGIGTTDAVASGDMVPIDAEFSFDLDLLSANIRQYVSDGIAAGEMFFAVTSLHSASMGGPLTFPSIYLDAGGVSLGSTATLELEIVDLPPGQTGDTDHDADVDLDDLNNVRNHFGATGLSDGTLQGDAYPFDGNVNIDDLNGVRNHFGSVEPAAVPEPVAAGLLVLGWATLLMSRVSLHRRGG